MQIDAVSASVDLRNPEEDEVNQLCREGRVIGDIMVHTVQRLRSGGSYFGPIQPVHLIFLSSRAEIGVTMPDERGSAAVTSRVKKAGATGCCRKGSEERSEIDLAQCTDDAALRNEGPRHCRTATKCPLNWNRS